MFGSFGERTPSSQGVKSVFLLLLLFYVFALSVIRRVSVTSMILQVPMLLSDDLHMIQVESSRTEAHFVTESAPPGDFCDPFAQEYLALWQLKEGL